MTDYTMGVQALLGKSADADFLSNGVNRRPKGTAFVEQRDGYVGRTFRAGGGVGRA